MCLWDICGSLLINEKISFFCLLNRFFCIINEESPSFAVSLIYEANTMERIPPAYLIIKQRLMMYDAFIL